MCFLHPTKRVSVWLLLALTLSFAHCGSHSNTTEDPDPFLEQPVQFWVTSPDGGNLLYRRTLPFAAAKDDRFSTIEIDTAQVFQSVEGFGYTLTGGSAYLIRRMNSNNRAALLEELFGKTDKALGISYLRISIGASDLDGEVFSYGDLPAGQTDVDLKRFSLSRDTMYLLPLLKEILRIRPELKIMGTPWSAPVWMKNNGSTKGGNLLPQYYEVYARYFVRYLQAMQQQGIRLDAITVQNEPQHGGNNPSMIMSAAEQTNFVKNYLGPALKAAGLTTQIIIWDHNCDNPGFPLAVLSDPLAKSFIHGTAFHLYAGDIGALSTVHEAHPDRDVYFTEQWTGANADFGGDLRWHIKNVIIGSMRNHSRTALEWNLASDPNYQPHTPGGCDQCKGALTIDGSSVKRNVSYYIIAHASRCVVPGSLRVESGQYTQLPNVAFLRPDGKKVLIVLNDSAQAQSFNIRAGNRWITTTVLAGNAATLMW